MADTETPAKGDEKQDEQNPEKGNEGSNGRKETDDIDRIAAQADKPDAVKAALQRERDAAKEARRQADALAAKVKAFEDRDKTEQEKLEERAQTAERKAADLERSMLRLRVASAKKLPGELADRLQGSTQEELEADADRLLELVKPSSPGDVDAGKGEVSTGLTFNELLRQGR